MKRTLLLVLGLAGVCHAGSNVRYALVIGNNVGLSTDLELDPLTHAERDATALARQLVTRGNFLPDRVVLVVGGGRAEILAAAAQLAQRHRQDQQELGELPTLFALFFTGHGLSGKLLTKDAPLDGQDLGHIISQMDARLSLAFLDACSSGSLDWDTLKAKGAAATPGFNPIAELPREVLDAEGSMWFVSSQAGQPSYEDQQLGGLFTHFLIEGFTEGPQDGVGVSLENLWEYARQHTTTYAAQHGRRQTPERIVRQLKSRSPVYLSFPRRRQASLVLDASTSGEFVLQYEQAALVERLSKRRGDVVEVPTFDGEVVLSRVSANGGALISRSFTLAPGAQVIVRGNGGSAQPSAPGFVEVPLRSKGESVDLTFTQRTSQTVLEVGGGWRPAWAVPGLLGPTQAGTVSVQLTRGRLSLGVALGAGTNSERFPTWAYTATLLSAEGFVGLGFDLAPLRLELELGGGPRWWLVAYADSARREALGGWAGGAVKLQLGLPFNRPWVLLQARAGAGAQFAPSVAADDPRTYLAFGPLFELGVAIPFFIN